MVDTSVAPTRGYAQMIPNRSSETIIPIIENVIRHGSKIYIDE
jgi:hypothetical protein